MSIFDPVRVLECPNCKQTIDASSQQCRFCSAPIDSATAGAAADLMAKVNQACSDASFLKTAGGAILVAFIAALLPIVGGIGTVAFLALLVAVPVMVIRWWAKFSGIVTADADFRRAKKTVASVTIAVSILLLIVLIRVIFAAVR